MKKQFTILIAAILVITAISLLVYYFGFANKTASDSLSDIPGQIVAVDNQTETDNTQEAPIEEQAEETEETTVIAANPTVSFSGVEGRQTSGSAVIISTTEGTFIRLEEDFSSSAAAPDNRLYLGNADGFQVEISKLKAPNGAQNFAVPSSIDINNYTHLWIHCKAFNVTYGVGEIIR